MRWIHPISADVTESADRLGGKGHGLVTLRRLDLPVPPGFVIGTDACREFLRDGRFPTGLADELAAAVDDLEATTGRRLGDSERPLVVSVRSGAEVSMPGMMDTILNLGLTAEAVEGVAAGTGDRPFALDSRLRFLRGFARTVLGVDPDRPSQATGIAEADPAGEIGRLETLLRDRLDQPENPWRQLNLAIEAVFSSWGTPRAVTYRELHGIDHELGTAVIVQTMVFGNRDDRSATGVAFSRDPNTGEPVPFGEVLFAAQGDDVVSGRSVTRPLSELADSQPAVWAELLDALRRVEAYHRDACQVEFTVEAGRLWVLQVRSGGLVGRAAVRVAVDLADAGVIDRREAVRRVSPRHLHHARTPRIETTDPDALLVRGLGASPGVATGRVATTSGGAVRMAADGPVVLFRPTTSPDDMRGLAAAVGVVTARGGPASHAAVVARSMSKPAVVGASGLTVDADDGSVSVAGRMVPEGTLVTIDGTGGDVVLGRATTVTAADDRHLRLLLAWADDA